MAQKSQNQGKKWPENAPKQVTQTLEAFLAASDMPQAYLFLGSSQENSIAREVAKEFTADLAKGVDALPFDANATSGIEDVREILQLASLMPVASDYKVVTMVNMQQASAQMQNSLLKTLEEPPKHSLFVLISSTPLLPTIMSRCQVISLQQGDVQEESDELAKAIKKLQSNKSAGNAERMVLVQDLADMEDELLTQVLESWLRLQVSELKTAPQNYKAVQATTDAIQSLQRNFNKKMVLQQFVLSGLA